MSLNELASEGERLCKSGDCASGIRFFEAALQIYEQIKDEKRDEAEQTKLMQTLSIIYNQMGNAYFYLQDYQKALEYHKRDLDLSEQFGDDSGKAKACGNIGNTLQLLGDYDEAILFSLRNLDISQKMGDVTGEARALYNLGNIYQSKGKHMGRLTYNDSRDPNNVEFANEIKEVLLKAIMYYRKTLQLVESKDRAAEGRTYGNLGNTYYFLGQFDSAIECHLQRLRIAKEYGDRPAERRAYSNLGNAHIFQGKFNEATEFYLKAMNVASMLGDKAIEAQSYYSLGNAYTLLQDYSVAIDFHLRHLQIAQVLEDRVGEARAYWSLGNAYAALGDLENAINYANKHLMLARFIGDPTSELTAKMNLYDFQNLLTGSCVRDSESALFTPLSSKFGGGGVGGRNIPSSNRSSIGSTHQNMNPIRKSVSIDSFYTNTAIDRPQKSSHLIKSTVSASHSAKDESSGTPVISNNHHHHQQQHQSAATSSSMGHLALKDANIENRNGGISISSDNLMPNGHKKAKNGNETTDEAPSFIEILNRAQSNRLDDQRCSVKRLTLNNRTNMTPAAATSVGGAKAPAPSAAIFKDPSTFIKNELMKEENYCKNDAEASIPNDEFFNLIMKSQKSRLEDQRSSLSMPKNVLSTPVLTSNKSRSSHLESSMSSSNTSSSVSNAPSSLEPVSAPSSSISLGSFSSKFLGGSAKKQLNKQPGPAAAPQSRQAVTVPSDDAFFSMLQKIQSRRLDEQRSVIKRSTLPTR